MEGDADPEAGGDRDQEPVDHLPDRHPGVRTDLARVVGRAMRRSGTVSAKGNPHVEAAEQLPQTDREDHEQDRGA